MPILFLPLICNVSLLPFSHLNWVSCAQACTVLFYLLRVCDCITALMETVKCSLYRSFFPNPTPTTTTPTAPTPRVFFWMRTGACYLNLARLNTELVYSRLFNNFLLC